MRSDCIFCNVERKGIIKKQQILGMTGDLYVLLSLNPATRGHCLVIPMDHYDSLVAVPQSLYGVLFNKAIEMGEKLKAALGAKAYTIKVNNELYKLEVGTGHVGHIHIHVIARYSLDDNVVEIPDAVSISELQKVKEEILKND